MTVTFVSHRASGVLVSGPLLDAETGEQLGYLECTTVWLALRIVASLNACRDADLSRYTFPPLSSAAVAARARALGLSETQTAA